MCRSCEKDAFHTISGNWATLEFVDMIIPIMRLVLPEANVAMIAG